jgi:glucan biosynthesis protein
MDLKDKIVEVTDIQHTEDIDFREEDMFSLMAAAEEILDHVPLKEDGYLCFKGLKMRMPKDLKFDAVIVRIHLTPGEVRYEIQKCLTHGLAGRCYRQLDNQLIQKVDAFDFNAWKQVRHENDKRLVEEMLNI